MRVLSYKCDICGNKIDAFEERLKIKHINAPVSLSSIPQIHLCKECLPRIIPFITTETIHGGK